MSVSLTDFPLLNKRQYRKADIMSKKLDLTGQKFNRLTVIKDVGRTKQKAVLWECQCECGKIKIVCAGDLKRGSVKSCGCLRSEVTTKRNITHGLYATRAYHSWYNMLQRCNNPKNRAYKNYGNRGITVCKRWANFENFFDDMGERPDGLTIERRNNELGYFKENCSWATRTEQNKNMRVQKKNKTGIRGICWFKPTQRYHVRIQVNGKSYHIGYFADLQKAEEARKQAEIKYWGIDGR